MAETIRNELLAFFADKQWISTGDDLEDEESLFDSGVLDSLALVELVNFIDRHYGVQVEDSQLVPDNFESLGNLRNYIERHMPKG